MAGVLDRESLASGISALVESADFQPGDRVRTFKGSLHGTVLKIVPDGRVVWKPDGSTSELMALPESLLRAK